MIFEKIAEIISDKLDVPKERITRGSTFDDLDADSLYVVEIMMMIEEALDVNLDDLADVENVGDIVEYVEAQLR